jgi:hypothetical protein
VIGNQNIFIRAGEIRTLDINGGVYKKYDT